MLDYYELKNDITHKLKAAGLPAEEFQVSPGSIHSEGFFYENRGDCYIYGYFERGTTEIICKTNDMDELEFHILKDIIVKCATSYELANRVWYQDGRRIWMGKALEWMQSINSCYFKKLNNDFNIILRDHPFDDQLAIRLNIMNIFYDIMKHTNIRYPYNIKNFSILKSLNSIKKDIKDSMNSKIIYQDAYITKTADRISALYNNIKELNIPLDSTVENSLQLALKKASYLQRM